MTTTPTPATGPRTQRRGLAVFAALTAVSAWFGAVGLIGGGLDFGDRLNRRLPFDSLVLGGIALAVIVAIPLSVLAWMAWKGDPRTGRVSAITGVLLVGWIAVQLVFLREFSWFQPVYAAVGVGFIAAGLRPAVPTADRGSASTMPPAPQAPDSAS